MNLARLILFIPALAFAQSVDLDFENNLTGWSQPTNTFHVNGLLTNQALKVPIGGTYWKNLPYEPGHHAEHWLTSYNANQGDQPTGTLTSAIFELNPSTQYFSFLIGGTRDVPRVYIALEIESDAGVLTQSFTATGYNTEDLTHVQFKIPPATRPRQARIRLVDNSPTGHINVDYIRFTTAEPERFRGPVWGLGDYHAHPMTHLGFGALKGVRTVWGIPGHKYDGYHAAGSRALNNKVAEDIPKCIPGHGGGTTAEAVINTIQERHPHTNGIGMLWSLLQGKLTSHGRDGAPKFDDFPSYLAGAHQQMHITQIHRAWEGGLRLMVALAVHNRGAEYLMSKVQNGEINPSLDLDVLKAQVCATRSLAQLNSSWMKIAYTPAEARDVIHDGKLALILGVEMAQLSELGVGNINEEIKYLWDLGIRQVFPVHGPDNKLAGAAVFQDAYNTVTDLLYCRPLNIHSANQVDDKFMDVEEGCSSAADPDCALYKLGPNSRVILKRSLLSLFKLFPYTATPRTTYDPKLRGHRNKRGLEPVAGVNYVNELMRHGMIVDLAHMSQHSVDDMYRVLASHWRSKMYEHRLRRNPHGLLPASLPPGRLPRPLPLPLRPQ